MRILYFAWLRSRVGMASEVVDPPAAVTDVAGLLDWLATRSPGHQSTGIAQDLVSAVHLPPNDA